MKRPSIRAGATLLLLALLSACSAARGVDSSDYAGSASETTGPDQTPAVANASIVTGVRKATPDTGGASLGVNAYLWRGTLDTIAFMPMRSADPFGSVIVTDWYSMPSAPGERFKIAAYILGRRLRTENLRLSVFRQVLAGDVWKDAPVAPGTTTALVDDVLARAVALRDENVAQL